MFKFFSNLLYSLFKLLVVTRVEVVDIFYGTLRPFAVVFQGFVFRLCDAVERSYSYAEEFIEIVGVDTEESHTFEHRDVFFLSFL